MKSKIRLVLLLLVTASVAYIAGRTRYLPEPPNLPAPFDPVAVGLEGKRADFDLIDIPIGELVRVLSETYRADVRLDRAALADIGADQSQPVTLKGTQYQLAEAIDHIRWLGDDEFLGFVVNGNTITLTRRYIASRAVELRVYDLRSL